MLWGGFKKLVIADRLAVLVDVVYANPAQYDGIVLLLATYLFAVQIYCDFSGYSDIAIGAARVLGYDLMENFRTPYWSRSIREFWSRWHISLSTWFRDYLYIPLGGNRVVKWRWYYNLFIVFLVSGLWHGANWTYVIWGALHGGYLVLAVMIAGFWKRFNAMFRLGGEGKLYRALQVFTTFHLAIFAWIFFRADSISDAILIVEQIGSWSRGKNTVMDFILHIGPGVFTVTIAFAGIFYLIDPVIDKLVKAERIVGRPVAYATFATILACTLIFGYFGEAQFIYFQF